MSLEFSVEVNRRLTGR